MVSMGVLSEPSLYGFSRFMASSIPAFHTSMDSLPLFTPMVETETVPPGSIPSKQN